MRDIFHRGWLPPGMQPRRRELIMALDLIAACAVAQFFLDRWLAMLLNEFQQASVVRVLSLMPSRVELSVLITVLMICAIAYRMIAHDRVLADRWMFALGCGVVAGVVADKLKLFFGRSPPEALLNRGIYEFHFLEGGNGFDSFPSSHAAMAAGIAGAVAIFFPHYRRLFFGLAAIVAASRFLIGARYLSDALLGLAVGFAIIALMQALFHQCGIHIEPERSSEH
jgi:membrane-associated phospholipid phosphatase